MLKKLAVLFFGLVSAFFIAEGAIRILIYFKAVPPYRTLSVNKIRDDTLLYKLPSGVYEDLDKNGYRNAAIPRTADIVTLGDSQTYGYNALREDSWPSQLARKTGLSVYNMGMGGYGPAQYYYLMDKVLAFVPKVIIIGFYPGNDFADACDIFQKTDYWKQFAKEREIKIDECLKEVKWPATGRFGRFETHWNRLRESIRYSNFLMFLKEKTILRDIFSYRRDLKIARANPENYFIVHEPEIETILNLDRLAALNKESPEIPRGIELAKFFFGEIAKKAEGKKIIVVFIPSKENILYDFLLSKKYDLPERYRKIVESERGLAADMSEYLSGLKIESIDPLPFLEKEIPSKNPPLFLNYLEDHPTSRGYGAIAEAVASLIRD